MNIVRLDRRAVLLGSAALLGACATAGAPSAQEEVAANILETTPENQPATFRNVDRFSPVRAIRRGSRVRALPPHAVQLPGSMPYDFGTETHTIDSYFGRNRTSGLIILKNGQTVIEKYALGNDERSRWTSFSTAKSMTSTLAGAALHEGAIRSLDDPTERYVPELRGSAYEGVTVRNVLRMCSGVGWNETYSATGDNDIARLGAAMAENNPAALLELMRTRPRAHPQGAKFNYSTGETYVLGAIVAGATGKHLADYYSEKIWSRAGMESDAYWQLDAENGRAGAGFGVSATLRDYARFGQFFLEDGVIDGARVLPQGWRDLAGQPDNPVTAHGAFDPQYPLGYGYQWWSLPTGANAMPNHDGAFTAEGIFGQFVYVNPREQVVAAVWSAWRDSWSTPAEMETYAMLGAAIGRLR